MRASCCSLKILHTATNRTFETIGNELPVRWRWRSRDHELPWTTVMILRVSKSATRKSALQCLANGKEQPTTFTISCSDLFSLSLAQDADNALPNFSCDSRSIKLHQYNTTFYGIEPARNLYCWQMLVNTKHQSEIKTGWLQQWGEDPKSW